MGQCYLVDRTALAKPGLTNIFKKNLFVVIHSSYALVMAKVGHLHPIYLSVVLESFSLLGLTNCVRLNTLKTKIWNLSMDSIWKYS